MYISKNYISMQNLKYSIQLIGLGYAGRPFLTMARMEHRQGGNLVPVGREVIRRHSLELKKLKKHPNKYRTPI
jgi:hypothetical protein